MSEEEKINRANGSRDCTIVDEDRLESDVGYRFKYAAEVIGLNQQDHDVLRLHKQMVDPHLPAIVAKVYETMLQYDAMKRHFLPKHSQFVGVPPGSIDEVTLDHQQTQFRKMKLQEYFTKLCTADWDDTFATLVDLVGHMHTPKGGNASLGVPVVQVSILLGLMNDIFLETISNLELSAKTQLALQRAYSKLFWVQNSMFIRHWIN